MRGRRALALLVLLLIPLFSGCLEEDLQVALRVRAGESLVLTGSRVIEGTLLVEEGASLVLRNADLVVAQALVLQGGILRAEDSRISFSGGFQRHDVELTGTAAFLGTRLTGVRNFEAFSGAVLVEGGGVEAGRLRVQQADLVSRGAAWSLGPASPDGFSGAYGSDGRALETIGGSLLLENGTLALAPGDSGVLLSGGHTRLANLTLDLSRTDEPAILLRAGTLELQGVALEARDLGRVLSVDGGTARLVDTPLPRNARHPDVSAEGRLEVAWTLTARVVAVPGNAPVPNATVTLRSAHAPAADAAQATTDAQGEARFVALQYVYGGGATRPGNPHALRAEAGGRTGASPAFVVEGPATVLVPVPLAGGAARAPSPEAPAPLGFG